MDREQVIALALQAGARNMEPYDYGAKPDRMIVYHEELERFAALVAAHEREECAQIAEEWLGPTKDRELHIAAAIRSRT